VANTTEEPYYFDPTAYLLEPQRKTQRVSLAPPDSVETIYSSDYSSDTPNKCQEDISTAEQLALIGGPQSVGKTYCLRNPIQLPSTGWTPIIDFRGTLDGRGHTISNLSVRIRGYGTAASAGLFGEIQTGDVTIKNLKVNGGINIYCASESSLTKLKSSNIFTTGGGLIGFVSGGRVVIEKCAFNGTVSIQSDVGMNLLDVVSAAFTVIPGTKAFIAGLTVTGLSELITLSDKKTTAAAGGLIGRINKNVTMIINNCTTSGSIYAFANNPYASFDDSQAYAGGLIGHVGGGNSNNVFVGNSAPDGNIKIDADAATSNMVRGIIKQNQGRTGKISGNNAKVGNVTTQ
jgi:hypothetical protein